METHSVSLFHWNHVMYILVCDYRKVKNKCYVQITLMQYIIDYG